MKRSRVSELAMIVACLALLPSGAGCSKTAVTVRNSELSTAISFRCMWWSPEQMNELNPNAPPPKNTEVIIQKWEYSDPVGVPHPDVVDVVVEVKNESSAAATDIMIDVAGRWRTDPFKDEKLARWDETVELQRVGPLTFAPHETRTVRVPVNLAQKMADLQKSESWPYALRAQVAIKKLGSATALSATQADLPIFQGD